jgi:hypothetical protein
MAERPVTEFQSSSSPPAGGFGVGSAGDFGPMGYLPSAPSATYAKWTLAVGAMSILGIFLCLLSLPLGFGAVAMGFFSLKRNKQHPDLYTGDGFAIAGIVLGGLSLLATVGFLTAFYWFAA